MEVIGFLVFVGLALFVVNKLTGGKVLDWLNRLVDRW